MRRFFIFSVYGGLFLGIAGWSQISNVTQTTGPFANINDAMVGANEGDSFTVTGNAGGGSISVNGVTFTGTTGPGTDVFTSTVTVGAVGVTAQGITCDTGNNTFLQDGADFTANNCRFIDALNTRPGVLVGGNQGGTSFTADGCEFSGNSLMGINLAAPNCRVVLTNCSITGNIDDGIALNGLNCSARIEDSTIASNGSEGIKLSETGGHVVLRNTLIDGNGAEGIETDDGIASGAFEIFNCVFSNNTVRPAVRLLGNTIGVVDNCDIFGNNEGIRFSDSSGNNLTLTNTCIHNNPGNGIRFEGNGPGQTMTMRNTTLYNNTGHGIHNETGATGNTFDIQYSIIAQWGGDGFRDDASATITENNNAYIHSNAVETPRVGVTAGGNTVDVLGGAALTDNFCSTTSSNADFLKIPVATGVSLNIDGSGGLAGAKTLCGNTLPIVRGSDAAEFGDIDAAVASAGTAAGEHFYVTGAAGGGLINKANITVRGPGPIDALGGVTTTAMISNQAAGTLLENLAIDGSAALVDGVLSNNSITLDSVSVVNNSQDGVDISGAGSQLLVLRSLIDASGGNGISVSNSNGIDVLVTDTRISNSGGAGLQESSPDGITSVTSSQILVSGGNGISSNRVQGQTTLESVTVDQSIGAGVFTDIDNGTFAMTGCQILNSGDRGVLVDSNNTGQSTTITNSLISVSGGEGLLSRGVGADQTLTNTTVAYSGGFLGPVNSREHACRIRGANSTTVVNGCVLFGADSGVRGGGGGSNSSVTVTDTCIYNCGRALRIDDGGGTTNSLTATNVTVFNVDYGIQNEFAAGGNTGNTFNVQYCILAEWNEAATGFDFGAFGFGDEVGDAAITENFNVYADTAVASTGRFNVAPGAGTEDVNTGPAGVFCSADPTALDFLEIGDNTPAFNIDGIGGNAGAKAQTCTITPPPTPVPLMSISEWSLYE